MTNEPLPMTLGLAQLLRDAGRAHHQAFIDVNGEDAEWPAWYADWLAPRVGGYLSVERQALADALEAVEAERLRLKPAPDWPLFYADRLLARHGAGPSA